MPTRRGASASITSAGRTSMCAPGCSTASALRRCSNTAISHPRKPPSRRNANCFTTSSRPATGCIRTDREALPGGVRVVGFTVSGREQVDDVGQRGLVAVMPVGALRRAGVEVALVAGGVGRLLGEPLAGAGTALLPPGDGDLLRHALPLPRGFAVSGRLVAQ